MSTPGLGDVETQVRTAIDAEPIGPRDQGLVALAIAYARELDLGGDVAKVGPALLACLESLLLSPRARAAAKKAVITSEPAANPLDQLADRRLRRGRPQAVDAESS